MTKIRNGIYLASVVFLLSLGTSGCASSTMQKPAWQQTLVVQDKRINELSGLSESIRYPGYFWANNDSGDTLRCFLISPQGETVAVVNVKDYENVDTESLRVAGTAEQSFVYISDTGDNRARRKQVEIYRFAEPEIDLKELNQDVSLSCEEMVLTYGDGATDAETLLVDKNQRIGIVTKTLLGSKLWVTENPFSSEPQTLQFVGMVPVEKWRRREQKYSALFTDGAISNDGKRLALMTYTTLFIWQIPEGVDLQDLGKVLSEPPMIDVNLPELNQPESLSFVGDNSRIVVSSEGINPPVMLIDLTGR